MPGIARSITTTSGARVRYSWHAASPLSASAITDSSGSDCSNSRNPVRTTA